MPEQDDSPSFNYVPDVPPIVDPPPDDPPS